MVQVRSSTYRHVYGDPTRKDKCYDNIRLTKNAFDANLAKSNGKYISLNWEASGGGSFAVIPTAEQGKLPDRFPLFDGHRGAVLDTDWNPFDESMVVSASDDGTIGIWHVPKDFSVHEDYGALDNCKDISPVKFLEGHGKKVGHVGFNPVAKNVLASTSLDNTVKVWDIESGDILFDLKHGSFVTSFSWNYDGTKLATVAKDKKLRIWDVRKEEIISEGKGHAGAKGSRVVWLGDNERVLTTGFSLVSDREMALWDANNIPDGPIGGFRGLDPSSGIVIPHFDPMTSIVYLGGRGDGKIVYYQYADDTLYDLFAYNSTSPTRGLGWVPTRTLDPQSHEVARVYKVHETFVEPIAFRLPLKTEGFLDSVYKLVEAGEPALTAKEWKDGKTRRPLVKDWKQTFHGKEAEAKEAPQEPKTPAEAKSEEPKLTKSATDSKKETKSETRTEAKKDTNGHAVDEKSKSDTIKSEEALALEKAEKQDSYEVLQSKGVADFLAKSTEDEEPELEDEPEEDSAWNDEPTPTESNESSEPIRAEDVKKDVNGTKRAEDSKQLQRESRLDDSKPDDVKPDDVKQVDAKPATLQPETKTSEPTKLSDDKKESSNALAEFSGKASAEAHDVHSVAGHAKLDEILKKLDHLTSRIAVLEAAAEKK